MIFRAPPNLAEICPVALPWSCHLHYFQDDFIWEQVKIGRNFALRGWHALSQLHFLSPHSVFCSPIPNPVRISKREMERINLFTYDFKVERNTWMCSDNWPAFLSCALYRVAIHLGANLPLTLIWSCFLVKGPCTRTQLSHQCQRAVCAKVNDHPVQNLNVHWCI